MSGSMKTRGFYCQVFEYSFIPRISNFLLWRVRSMLKIQTSSLDTEKPIPSQIKCMYRVHSTKVKRQRRGFDIVLTTRKNSFYGLASFSLLLLCNNAINVLWLEPMRNWEKSHKNRDPGRPT